ncbi:ExbD/TolR family protein [Thalassovita sp.]|jgi:biopolymer transport protein ExbD|uniref:ExbD/TolR family protein n=1 Tax=Thalassovita sp. TaxID=1979401 RepID=UPI003B5C658C
MEFPSPSRRPRGESIVPMINVVFLLLIFFLMTSQLVPPEPFQVTPPTATSAQQPQAELTLYVDGSGLLAFEDLRGTEAIAALASQNPQTLRLRADAQIEAQQIARILRQLAQAGLPRVELVVTGQ